MSKRSKQSTISEYSKIVRPNCNVNHHGGNNNNNSVIITDPDQVNIFAVTVV